MVLKWLRHVMTGSVFLCWRYSLMPDFIGCQLLCLTPVSAFCLQLACVLGLVYLTGVATLFASVAVLHKAAWEMNGTALLPSVTELRPDTSVPLIIPTLPEEVPATHNAVPPHSVDEECTDRRPSVTATALYLWGSVLTALTYSDTGGTTGEELKPPDRYCPHCSKPKPPSDQRNATHCNFHQPLVRAFPGLDHYSFPNRLVCSNCPNSCTVRYPDRHNMPSHTPKTDLSNGLELKTSICADTSLSRLKTFIVPG